MQDIDFSQPSLLNGNYLKGAMLLLRHGYAYAIGRAKNQAEKIRVGALRSEKFR